VGCLELSLKKFKHHRYSGDSSEHLLKSTLTNPWEYSSGSDCQSPQVVSEWIEVDRKIDGVAVSMAGDKFVTMIYSLFRSQKVEQLPTSNPNLARQAEEFMPKKEVSIHLLHRIFRGDALES